MFVQDPSALSMAIEIVMRLRHEILPLVWPAGDRDVSLARYGAKVRNKLTYHTFVSSDEQPPRPRSGSASSSQLASSRMRRCRRTHEVDIWLLPVPENPLHV